MIGREYKMFLFEFIIAFSIAVIFVLVLRALFGRRAPFGSVWILLLFLFLVTWAGGVWLIPFGPTLFDVAWLPYLVVGVFIAIVLATTVPPEPTYPRTVEQAREEETTATVLAGLTIFFWIAIIFTLIAILLAYLI